MIPNTESLFQTLDLKKITGEGEFEGYASKFGDVDNGNDVVVRGAFTKSLNLKGAKTVKMLWQHDPSQPIGVWNEIKEDDIGLYVKGRLLTSVQRAKEAYDLMKEGVLDGLSIGYKTIKANRDNKSGIRQLMEVSLLEISLVTFPMLSSATVTSVKGKWTKRDVERVLRDADMPNAMAVKLIAGGWDAANTDGQGDPDDGMSDLAAMLREMNETLKRRL